MESVDAALTLSGMAILPDRRTHRGPSFDRLLLSRTLSLTIIAPASSTVIRPPLAGLGGLPSDLAWLWDTMVVSLFHNLDSEVKRCGITAEELAVMRFY